MKKLVSGLLVGAMLMTFAFGIGCSSKKDKADENTNNMILILLMIGMANNSTTSKTPCYNAIGSGCSASAPYTCSKSSFCSNSTTCSNLSCDVATTADLKTQVQAAQKCDDKEFDCVSKNIVTK